MGCVGQGSRKVFFVSIKCIIKGHWPKNKMSKHCSQIKQNTFHKPLKIKVKKSKKHKNVKSLTVERSCQKVFRFLIDRDLKFKFCLRLQTYPQSN